MKIKLLDIRGFGRFSNMKIVPSRGFNLVFGNNESGKSTLAEFIQAMLFGLKLGKRARNTAQDSVKSYKPWNSDTFSGVIECVLDNGAGFRIDRNFERGTVHIRDESGTDVSERYPLDRDSGPRFAEEHLKVSAAVFERSAMIRQTRSAIDDAGREALLEKLANLNATGADDQSASKAVDALNSTLLEKVGTGRTTTRPLDRIRDRLSGLGKEKERILGLNEHYLDTFLLLKSHEARLRELQANLEELSGCRDFRVGGRLLEIKTECAALDDRITRMQNDFRALDARVEKEERFGEMTELSMETLNTSFFEYQGTLRLTGELTAERNRLIEALAALETRMARLVPLKDSVGRIEKAMYEHGNSGSEAAAGNEKPKRSPFPVLVSTCAIIMGAAAFIFSLLHHEGVWRLLRIPSLVLVFIGLLITVINLAGKKTKRYADSGMFVRKLADEGFSGIDQYLARKEELRNASSEYKDCQVELDKACGALAALEAKQAELAGKIGLFLGASHAGEFDQGRIEYAVELYKSGYREYRENNNRLQLLEQDIGSCTQKRGSLLREASAISKKDIRQASDIPDAGYGFKPTPGTQPSQFGSLVEIEEQMRRTGDAIKASELEIRALETRLENIPPLDDLAGIEEESLLLLEEKERLEAAGESLSIAMEIIRQVSREHQKNYTAAMNEKIGELITQITDGRYSGVNAGPGLRISLEAPETEELVPLNQLSGATIDQVYLAMRIAALNILERGGESIPLIMDEPFSQYDESRVQSTLRLLKKITANRQVFLFTCRKRELELAREIWGEELNLIAL